MQGVAQWVEQRYCAATAFIRSTSWYTKAALQTTVTSRMKIRIVSEFAVQIRLSVVVFIRLSTIISDFGRSLDQWEGIIEIGYFAF